MRWATSVASCGPYRQVAATGGLECPNFRLGTRRMTISFIFSDSGLTRVQLWFYEGRSAAEAREATAAMLAYLSTHGRVRSSEANGPVTPDAILSRLRTMARGAKAGQAVRVQVLTTDRGAPPIAHGSVTLARTGFYVFAFLSDSKSAQPRR